ncbi:hypothetical protein HDV05_001567 [Chytridiales sp. JEL 0842]|nr:hypothetical protein HDV05_001567 [Chytridiales sp. JEL 0842]
MSSRKTPSRARKSSEAASDDKTGSQPSRSARQGSSKVAKKQDLLTVESVKDALSKNLNRRKTVGPSIPSTSDTSIKNTGRRRSVDSLNRNSKHESEDLRKSNRSKGAYTTLGRLPTPTPRDFDDSPELEDVIKDVRPRDRKRTQK